VRGMWRLRMGDVIGGLEDFIARVGITLGACTHVLLESFDVAVHGADRGCIYFCQHL
jgi:hypothetical protein